MPIDWKTPLVEIDTPKDDKLCRKILLANARACIGLSAGIPETRPIFEKLLGQPSKGEKWDLDRPFSSWKTPDGRWRTLGVSTCALCSEGLHRRLGVSNPALYLPYRTGTTIARTLSYARSLSAWRIPAKDAPLFDIGDYLLIGCHTPEEELKGSEHVLTPLHWLDEDTFESVEGGMVDKDHKGLQCIKLKTRKVVRRDGAIWIEYASTPGIGRKIQGWAQLSKLKVIGKSLAPIGWEEA
jgi:hypothetical protein